jgi:hypothetical protein
VNFVDRCGIILSNNFDEQVHERRKRKDEVCRRRWKVHDRPSSEWVMANEFWQVRLSFLIVSARKRTRIWRDGTRGWRLHPKTDRDRE